ncbi:hypothetical protein COO91_06554 [Nostoc flagelliforme CCNUN1]|uniref:Uncharacterized protein n=1 Tax=Nostoc flagelliforme CCNUN1 TaxID=2038116 RepID=A0A2K8SYL0_9NOSO|nr:hypothetical protein COO91_06554 [Nostoc flagelliforme CCNUN1]
MCREREKNITGVLESRNLISYFNGTGFSEPLRTNRTR